MKITRFIHENFPNITVVTKTETVNSAERFRKAGASLVVSRNFETSLQLSKIALLASGFEARDIEKAFTSYRNPNSDLVKEILKDRTELGGKAAAEEENLVA